MARATLRRADAASYRIGELAARLGMTERTIRYYEEVGLLARAPRSSAGYRRYTDGTIEELRFIRKAQALGFSLDEIMLMFAPDGRPRIDRQMLAAQADKLDRTIHKLSAMRDGLRHASVCPAPSHMECPTFRRYLRAAASGAIGGPKKKLRGHRRGHQFPQQARGAA